MMDTVSGMTAVHYRSSGDLLRDAREISDTTESGKGYAFVARQQHIHTEKQDDYIGLVFYNDILKCFVLIDLKTGRITLQDVGQKETEDMAGGLIS